MSRESLRLAVAQAGAATDQTCVSLASHIRLLRIAGAQRADVIVFPELSLSGYLIEDPAHWAAEFMQTSVAAIRAELGGMTAIVGLPRPSDTGGAMNSAAIITDRDGLEFQDKIYLPNYSRYTEGDRFVPGSDLKIFELGGMKVAILICEDAWHGSLSYIARLHGADVIIHPAASARGAVGADFDSEDGWTAICRAEAIYYATYVVFSNLIGEDHNQVFWGGSKVVAPGGRVVGQMQDSEGIFVVDLRRDVIDAARDILPMMEFEDLPLVRRKLASATEQLRGTGT